MPSVVKHVIQQNPTFSTKEAIKEALAMEDRYNEANKERNAKGEVNNMIAPVQIMVGDTMTLYWGFSNDDISSNTGSIGIVME